jgi:drug/metabolite transporter (DMT)-like permease
MPQELAGSLGVVALGLVASASWGIGDFGGGLTSRLAPVAGVLLWTQVIGSIIAFTVSAIVGEPAPSTTDLLWIGLSSLLGVAGLAALYIGLARGRMGVVAPVTGVMVAAMPAGAGLLLQGALPALALVGIALAMGSVVLVSRTPAELEAEASHDTRRPSGLKWALAGGVLLGFFTITVAGISHGLVFGPLARIRLGEAIVLLIAIGLWRLPTAIPRRLWPAILGIGVLDMFATGSYIAATQVGPLAIAGAVSSLYPVVTTILAAVVLRERLGPINVAGVVLAATSIALIAVGTPG